MKRLVWKAACAISVMGCALVLGCGDDSSSTSPQENVGSSSSFVEGQGTSAGENLGSSAADNLGSSGSQAPVAESSAGVESSSSAAAQMSLCLITVSTKTGYENIAVTWGSATICLPLENCDTSAVITGYPDCYDGRATVDGCSTGMHAEVVDECDSNELPSSCETPNGTAYKKGRFNVGCEDMLR